MPTPPTTYQPTPFLSELLKESVIPEGKLAYFRARLGNRLHELVLSTFLKVEKRDHLSRAELAKRLGRRPEQITRWFASPGNWELDTVSDLLLGMGYEPELSVTNLRDAGRPSLEESPQLPNANLGARPGARLQTEESLASMKPANDSLPPQGLPSPIMGSQQAQTARA